MVVVYCATGCAKNPCLLWSAVLVSHNFWSKRKQKYGNKVHLLDIKWSKLRTGVSTSLRCGGICEDNFAANLSPCLTVEEFWKSINIWWNYGQKFSVLFLTHDVLFAWAILIFYVAGVILLHCVFLWIQHSYVAFNMRCQENITLSALHVSDFTANSLTRLSGAHFTNLAAKITQSVNWWREIMFRTQTLPSSWTEQIFSCPI